MRNIQLLYFFSTGDTVLISGYQVHRMRHARAFIIKQIALSKFPIRAGDESDTHSLKKERPIERHVALHALGILRRIF
jgi:hypothetical protein